MRWLIEHDSRESLQTQIAACVRRGVATGELQVGEQLPPAADLAAALSVDRNTVLAAYRQMRDEGLLEFRRGRGARVVSADPAFDAVTEQTRRLIELARAHGVSMNKLIQLIKEMS
jgi:GntR family transcriptional regulator